MKWFICNGCCCLFTCEPARHGSSKLDGECWTPRLWPIMLAEGLDSRKRHL